MAVSKVPKRLVADVSIGVADLLECLEKWLDDVDHNRLRKTVEPPVGTSWKTAPDPTWLAPLAPLWEKYLTIASNGVLPSKKHRIALEKLQDRRNVNQTKQSPTEFAEDLDEWIRIGLAQLRSMKQAPIMKQRAFRKATAQEIEVLECILGMLTNVEPQSQDPPEDDSQGSSVAAPESALVPVSAGHKSSKEPTSSAEAGGKVIELVNPESIFESVLKRPSVLGRKNTSPPKVASPQHGKQLGHGVFSGFFGGWEDKMALNADEKSLLRGAAQQEPLNKGFSSQLQRANKALKELHKDDPKGEDQPKKKPKAKAKSKSLGKNTKPKVGGTKPTKPKAKAKSQMKTPAKVKKTTAEVEAEPEALETPPKLAEKTSNKGSDTLAVPEGFDPEATRAVNRKRYTSRAWHREYDACSDLDEDLRKERARESSQKASVEFEKLWPKPEVQKPKVLKKQKKMFDVENGEDVS